MQETIQSLPNRFRLHWVLSGPRERTSFNETTLVWNTYIIAISLFFLRNSFMLMPLSKNINDT